MKVVVCGGGVVGVCTAYYLQQLGVNCTIVERCSVACAASGKAGGFLARDWCKSDGALYGFAQISFDLHKQLASTLGGAERYDYRPMNAYSVTINDKPSNSKSTKLPWLDGSHVYQASLQSIGTPDAISQLHPFKFVQTLSDEITSRGVEIIKGEISGIENKGTTFNIHLVNGENIECDVVILCLGPWTGLASDWFQNFPSTYGQKAHSITVFPKSKIPAEAVFTDYGEFSPELYPRPDGQVYVCGLAENPVPSKELPSPADVKPSEGSCEKVKEMCDLVSSSMHEGKVTLKQACCMPLTQDGLPLVGTFCENVYVGAGHGCWGILNAPATGKSLASLVVHGKSVIDIDAFNPNRFS